MSAQAVSARKKLNRLVVALHNVWAFSGHSCPQLQNRQNFLLRAWVAEGMAGACGGPFYQKAHLEGGAKIRWRPHSFAPANHKCGNICLQTVMCSLSIATPQCGGVWYVMVEVCEGAPASSRKVRDTNAWASLKTPQIENTMVSTFFITRIRIYLPSIKSALVGHTVFHERQ